MNNNPEPEPIEPQPVQQDGDEDRSEAGRGADDLPSAARAEVPPTGNTMTNLARTTRRIE